MQFILRRNIIARKKRDTSIKRQSIIDAAINVFIDDGYDKASMDKIAGKAGASKRTVYNHFASKPELFSEVINTLIEQASALKRIAYDSQKDIASQLEAFIDAKIEIAENPIWMGMMKVAIGVFIDDPLQARQIMQRAEQGGDSLIKWLQAADADGRMNIDNAELAAGVFWAMAGGAFFWPSLFYGPMLPAMARVVKAELVKMFISRYGR